MSATITKFPRSMKRGRKATKGPCAKVVPIGVKSKRELYVALAMLPRVPHPEERERAGEFFDRNPEFGNYFDLAKTLRDRQAELREYLGL